MIVHRLPLLLVLVAGTAGCSLNPETGMAGIDPDATIDAGDTSDADATIDAGDTSETRIWNSSSDSIDVHWFSFWQGGTRFRKDRGELTADELAIVETMTVIPPTEECWSDSGEATVTVTAAGTEHLYVANEYDGTCGGEGTLIDYEPVKALIDLAGCLSAKSYDGSTLATAPAIAVGDGCYHGLFSAYETTPEWWFLLDVATGGFVQVAIDGCGDRSLELALLDAAGTTTIASTTSAVGVEPCPVIRHAITEPGRYVIRVDMHAGTYAGDFYLRVDSGT